MSRQLFRFTTSAGPLQDDHKAAYLFIVVIDIMRPHVSIEVGRVPLYRAFESSLECETKQRANGFPLKFVDLHHRRTNETTNQRDDEPATPAQIIIKVARENVASAWH